MTSSIQLDFDLFKTTPGFQRRGEQVGDNARLDDADVPAHTSLDVSRYMRRIRRFNYVPRRMIQATTPPVKMTVGREEQESNEYDYRMYGIECAHPQLRDLELRPTTTMFGVTAPSRRNGAGGLVLIPFLSVDLASPITGYVADVDGSSAAGIAKSIATLMSTQTTIGPFTEMLNGLMGAFFFFREMGFGRLQETLIYEGVAHMDDWFNQAFESMNLQEFIKGILDRLLGFVDDNARDIIAWVLAGLTGLTGASFWALMPVVEIMNSLFSGLFTGLNGILSAFEIADMEISSFERDNLTGSTQGILGFAVPTYIFKKCPNGAYPCLASDNVYRQWCDFCALDSYYLIGRGYGRMPDFVGAAIDFAMLTVQKAVIKSRNPALEKNKKELTKLERAAKRSQTKKHLGQIMVADIAIGKLANVGKAGLPAIGQGNSYMHAHPRQMSIRLSVIYLAIQTYFVYEEFKLAVGKFTAHKELYEIVRMIRRIMGMLQEMLTVISYLEDSTPTNFHMAHFNDWITYSTHAKFHFKSNTKFDDNDSSKPPKYMDPTETKEDWQTADGFFEVPHTLNVHDVDYFHQKKLVGAKYQDISWLYSQPCKFRWGGTGEEREKHALFRTLKSLFPTDLMGFMLRELFGLANVPITDWKHYAKIRDAVLAILALDIFALITVLTRDTKATVQKGAAIDPSVPAYTLNVIEIESVKKPDWYEHIERIEVQVRSWDLYPHEERHLSSLWLSAQALSELEGMPKRTEMNLAIYPELNYAHLYERHWWRKVVRMGQLAYRDQKLRNATDAEVSLKKPRFHYHVPWRLNEAGERITYTKYMSATFTDARAYNTSVIGMTSITTSKKSKICQVNLISSSSTGTDADVVASQNLPGVCGWRVQNNMVELYGGKTDGCAFPAVGSILHVDTCDNNDNANTPSFTMKNDTNNYGIQGLYLRVRRRGGMWGYIDADGAIASTQDGATNRELLGALDVAYCEVINNGSLPAGQNKLLINTKDAVWQRAQQARGAYAIPSIYSSKTTSSARGGARPAYSTDAVKSPEEVTSFNDSSDFSVSQLRHAITNSANRNVYKLFWNNGTRTNNTSSSTSTLIPTLPVTSTGIKPHMSVREGESIFIKAGETIGIPYGRTVVQIRNLETGAWEEYGDEVTSTLQTSSSASDDNDMIKNLTPRVSGPVRVGEVIGDNVFHTPLSFQGRHAYKSKPEGYDGGTWPKHKIGTEENWRPLAVGDRQRLIDADGNYIYLSFETQRPDYEGRAEYFVDLFNNARFHRAQNAFARNMGRRHVTTAGGQDFVHFDGMGDSDLNSLLSLNSRIYISTHPKNFEENNYVMEFNNRESTKMTHPQGHGKFVNLRDNHKEENHRAPGHPHAEFHDYYLWCAAIPIRDLSRVMTSFVQVRLDASDHTVVEVHKNELYNNLLPRVTPTSTSVSFDESFASGTCSVSEDVLKTMAFGARLRVSVPNEKASKQLRFTTTVGITQNDTITGTGLPSGTTVTDIDTNLHTVTLSNELTERAAGRYRIGSTEYTTCGAIDTGERPVVRALENLKNLVTESDIQSKVYQQPMKIPVVLTPTKTEWTATIEHDERHTSMMFTTATLTETQTTVDVNTDYVDDGRTEIQGGSVQLKLATTTNVTSGASIVGAGVPSGTTITAVDTATKIVTLSAALTQSATGSYTIGTAISILEFQGGSNQLKLATTTNVTSGASIVGAGVPSGTTITAVDTATKIVTLSAALTQQATGSYTIGPAINSFENGSVQLKLATTTGVTVGASIVGAGVPSGTTITAVDTATKIVTLSAALTQQARSYTIGISSFPSVYAWIGSECVKITNLNGTTLTITRAQRGTEAKNHSIGTEVFVPPAFTDSMTSYRLVDPIFTTRCAVVTINNDRKIAMRHEDFQRIDVNLNTTFALYEAHTSMNKTDYEVQHIDPSGEAVLLTVRSGASAWDVDKIWPCIMVVRGIDNN